jgi:uncharacterized protein YndB with AHSA1/START domain
MENTAVAERELVLSRVMHAPAALVFNAWTESSQLEQWWSPPEYETHVREMAVEPDGRTRLIRRDPDGFEYATTLVYADITAAHTLTYMQTDEGDAEQDATAFGVAVQFEEEGPESTRVTLSLVFKTAELRDRAALECDAGSGAYGALRRLDQFLQEFLP